MFSCRSRIPSVSCPPAYFPKRIIREQLDERGFVTLVNEMDGETLPDLECYDLGNMLRSGVPLQETRTDIVSCALDQALEDLETLPDSDVKEPAKNLRRMVTNE